MLLMDALGAWINIIVNNAKKDISVMKIILDAILQFQIAWHHQNSTDHLEISVFSATQDIFQEVLKVLLQQ